MGIGSHYMYVLVSFSVYGTIPIFKTSKELKIQE